MLKQVNGVIFLENIFQELPERNVSEVRYLPNGHILTNGLKLGFLTLSGDHLTSKDD